MLISDLDKQELVSGTKGVVVDFQNLSAVYADLSQPWGAQEQSRSGNMLPLVQFDIPGKHKKRFALMTPVGYYEDSRDLRSPMSRTQAGVK